MGFNGRADFTGQTQEHHTGGHASCHDQNLHSRIHSSSGISGWEYTSNLVTMWTDAKWAKPGPKPEGRTEKGILT
jgi:hypothetical protein